MSEPVTVPEAGAEPVPTEPQSSLYLFASWILCLSPLSLPTEPVRTLHLMRRTASFLLSLEYLWLLPYPVVSPETSVGSKGQSQAAWEEKCQPSEVINLDYIPGF